VSRYEPLGRRRRAVVVALCVLIAIDLLVVVSALLELNLVDRVEAGEAVTDSELDGNDNRQAAVAFLNFGGLIACGVFFIRWLRAACRNADVVAPGLRRYGHGWAIGAWFVPFLNLWRPKQIVNDVWRAGGSRGSSERLPWWLDVWWAGWIASGILSQVGFRLDREGIDQVRAGDRLDIADASFEALIAVIAMIVVLRITDRLDGRGAALGPAAVSPAPAVAGRSDDPNAATSVPPPSVAPGWSAVAPERVQQPG
jgi:Domain of unknown function (DUF4328)